jgi:L-threonylcarbamoyladenylate synthase
MPGLFPVDPDRPDPAALADAARRLLRGDLVAFPTESYYGLGALATSPQAIDRLFAVKQRRSDQPILVIVADREQLGMVIERITPLAERCMAHFWPGPLTLLLPARPTVVPALTGNTGKLGVRLPGLALPRLLAAAVGAPVTATSANRSGAPPPTTARQVEAAIGGEIDAILDGGPTAGGPPSTVLDASKEPPVLIREGRVSAEQLLAVCGTLKRSDRVRT